MCLLYVFNIPNGVEGFAMSIGEGLTDAGDIYLEFCFVSGKFFPLGIGPIDAFDKFAEIADSA